MVSDIVARLLKVNKEEMRKMTITTQTRSVCVAGGLYWRVWLLCRKVENVGLDGCMFAQRQGERTLSHLVDLVTNMVFTHQSSTLLTYKTLLFFGRPSGVRDGESW